MKHRRIHTREFKLEVCTQIESGQLSQAQACREHRLSATMLARWVQEFRDTGVHAFGNSAREELDKDRRIEQLEQALGQAHLEIKILKTAIVKKVPGNGS